MKLLNVLLIVLLLLAALPEQAEGEGWEGYSPIQVDLYWGGTIRLWDCFPYSDSQPATEMFVYMEYPTGIATYVCYMTGAGTRHYVPQSRNDMAKR